jgi:hypothetical protein
MRPVRILGACAVGLVIVSSVAAAPKRKPAVAAPLPPSSVGPVTGPIADYWVSAATTSGFGSQFLSGQRPSMGSLLGMATGKASAPQRNLTLQLSSSQPASGGAEAAHMPPPGLGVGTSLPLLTPQPAKPGPRRETDPGDPSTYQRPKAKLLIYWGCGEHVSPGQPVVVDFSTVGTGTPLPDLGGGVQVRAERPPAFEGSISYGHWPNERTRLNVPATASLVGAHSVHGDYSPDIAFQVTPDLDFMPPFDVQNAGSTPAGGKRLAWNPIATANGYYLQLIGAQGGRGSPTDAVEMVFWSSSTAKPGLFGGGLADYLPPEEVRRLVAQKAVLPPSASECVVPAEVIQSAPMGLVMSIAYGPEQIFTDPPRPQRGPWDIHWRTRVRLRSTNTLLLGMPGARVGAAAQAQQAPGAGDVAKKLFGGLRPF